jgi:putative adenylate-forming enzyme
VSHWNDTLGIAAQYMFARRRDRLRTPEQLRAHQQRRWQVLRAQVASRSPFYARFRDVPFEDWPQMDKRDWMRHFDTVNTRGIHLRDALAVAERAERTRDFRPMLGNVSVGLSTGTSGARGVFLVSAAERRRWAATMLAKLLPDGLVARERVALLLRAGNNLYDSIGGARLRFRYFDMLRPFNEVVQDLQGFAPTILVGPAQVLALVARCQRGSRHGIAPRRVISAAEVLDARDGALLEQAWDTRVEQIYQATEGFLGQTCTHGTIHLNEDCMIVEREWIDVERRRFVPIITDLYRRTQPVIRYRLNDILVAREAPCACGSLHMAIERIEGREDDIVWLPAAASAQPVALFPNSLARAVLNAAPAIDDYQIDQVGESALQIYGVPEPDLRTQAAISNAVAACCRAVGARVPTLTFATMPEHQVNSKRRRVRGMGTPTEPLHA